MVEAVMGSDEEAATDMLVALVDAGYEGHLVSRNVDGVLLLEIRVGPYASLSEARQVGAVIGRAHDVALSVVVVIIILALGWMAYSESKTEQNSTDELTDQPLNSNKVGELFTGNLE